eukprot:Skav203835  [mRNA]  locus=scaffold4932:42892:55316:- [translate_table: standard]
MYGLRSVLATLLVICDPLVRSHSWGIGSLGIPFFEGANETCPAGESCEKGKATERETRGVPSRPESDPQQNSWWRWPWGFSWLVKISLKILSDAAHTSMHYCGTLCASIGLAAKWSYWLATASVALFMVQLLVWTCNWILIPLGRHSLAFWRYLRGHGQWYELAQIHGVRVFRPKWVGPRGREEWTSGYVQQEVRARGEGREPVDLLVTDGTAIARLRHGTLRGRTNRHGFVAMCDSVHASSHRYYRNQLEGMECRVHLCATHPCGQQDDDCLHAVASATIPRHLDFDLQDAAGKGPLARCATAAWLCGYSTVGACGSFWKALKNAVKWVCCCACCCSKRRKGRSRVPPSSGASTPRHENSETESEGEEDATCQAESVAFMVNGKATPLANAPCKDAARGDKLKLLPSDAEVSSAEDLKHEDGNFYFNCCHHHRALYEGQAAKRTCVFEGCDREVRHPTRSGLRLCKLHGAKDEKARPSSKGKPTFAKHLESQPLVDPMPGSEARIAPGLGRQQTVPTTSQPSTQATSLGKYLREVLEGKEEVDALQVCVTEEKGPRETWEELKEQATAYVTKLPRDYPPVARRAIVNLVTEECPQSLQGVEDPVDPVLSLRQPPPPIREEEFQPLPPARPVEVLPQAATSSGQEAFLANVTSLYRPRGSATLPTPMLGGEPQGRSAYATFASVSRPRHAGAYTDGEPPRMDETTKALQAIAKAVTSKDEAASHDKGKLASIGKLEERLVFLVRGCDALTVPLGKATVGKELFHSPRATSTQGRPQLRLMQFPVNINNRVAYGLAAMSLGGKDVKSLPEYSLSAADFNLASEEEFDNWTGCSDLKLEKRPKPPMTLNSWYRNALREAWAISCVYGTEHYSSFEQAASYLLKLGEEHAYMWPAHAIFSVWEELWARFVEELKDVDRELRRAMKEESPSFERIRFFVTAPGEDGEPWLRLPRTFFLEDTAEYFHTDVIPRHNRLLSRACWQVALKKTPGGHLYGGKAGEGPEAWESRPGPKTGKAETQAKALLGPPLTNKEAARALDHRPKEKKGAKYLCWDNMCHRGCARPSACPHSHGPAPRWESMDWSVQLQLIRRGGLKGKAKLTEAQASEQMETIRKTQAAKNQEMIADGKRLKKVGEHEPTPPDSKVGKSLGDAEAEIKSKDEVQEAPPDEFTCFNPTDQEAEMMSLLEGPDFQFFEDYDADKQPREAPVDAGTLPPDVQERLGKMKDVEHTQLTEGYGEQLRTFLNNQLLQLKEANPEMDLSFNDVRSALELARDQGCPSLSAAADEALQGATSHKTGYSPNVGHLSSLDWQDGVGRGVLTWEGGSWDVYDFGDKLYPCGGWPLELLSSDQDQGPEARQCLLLHCAAGYLHRKHGRVPSQPEVQRQTNLLREELVAQATEASRHLGECPETLPRSEADLRVFVHDLLHWSHDKDYRTMASFPSSSLLGYTLHVVRMASDQDLSTEVITGALSSGHANQQIHLLVHQGHMRLLVPKALDRSPPIIREVIAAGWECHLEAASGSEASVRARDYLLCPRCSHPEEVPRKTGARPPSVLGLHLKVEDPGKIGAWTPSTLELKELDDTQWSNQDIIDWLGPQGLIFQQALTQGLDFLEVYAGEARASKAVTAKGGLAIHLGLDHGQDFRLAKDRSLGRALLKRAKPRHYWGSFPCSPFCAWIRLAILRNCDMTLRLKEGRLHLGYALDLAGLQLADGRDAHVENPLTSMAWKEPRSLTTFADLRWLRARLDQCQTGLSSPSGGLHLKPTLIRTTDPAMQQALSLTCPKLHSHDPVEGAATARSAMYSPHMADIIATVVLRSRLDASVGGGDGALFSSPARVGGGTEASFSPGGTPTQWYQGLKGPDLKGPLIEPLTEGLEKTCKAYLEHVTVQEYSKEAFKTAATLGISVLQEAGGVEEAHRGIRRTWVMLKGDHFEGLHSDFFDGLVSEPLLEKARENAIWGISACYEGGVGRRVRAGPHPSLKEYLEEAAQQLWKDASRGRVLICFDQGQEELEGVVSVAMARVPKMLPNRTISSKGRVIWDARPVNEFCHKTRHPPALQPKHEEVARLIVWWQTKHPNTPILLSKKDVADAFKWLPVRGSDTRLFAADLPGCEFEAPGKNITVVYNSLTFGWVGAPGEYMLFAWVLKLGHSAFCPPDAEWNDATCFQSLVLMDDAVLIEPKVGIRPWLSVKTMEVCTQAALGPGAINAAKDEVEGALETRKLIWGLMYDTENNTRTLPAQKLEKASHLLHLPEFDHGNTRVPLKLVQELRGNQQFWISVLPSLKPLLSATNALLGPPTAEGLAQPRGDPEQQRRAWVRFWEAIELQRLLVDNRTEWGVRFTHPMTEALSLRELLALPGGRNKVVWASGDATLDRVGAVDWSNKQAYSLEVKPYQQLIEAMEREALNEQPRPRRASRPDATDEPSSSEEPERLMVALTELLAVLLLAVSQHAKWKGKVVLYMGDNQVVVRWINSRQAKHPFASYLLQMLAAIEACHSFHLHTAYVRTYHNVVADALTRQDAEEVLAAAGLECLPKPDDTLRRFLDRGWQRRALIWAGQADADTAQALRLSQEREGGTPFPLTVELSPAYLRCFSLEGFTEGYLPALRAAGVEILPTDELPDDDSSPRRVSRPGKGGTPHLLCATLPNQDWEGALEHLERQVSELDIDLVWADSRNQQAVEAFAKRMKGKGYHVEARSVCGRSLKDQVWWKRWILTASQETPQPFHWVTTDDEPCTPPLVNYPMDWWAEGGSGNPEEWEKGILKLDSSMPYLGATKPKPAGTLTKPNASRALVWDPTRPLPGLHDGSCDGGRKDCLLLLGKGPDGPAARPLLPEEATHLILRRKDMVPKGEEEVKVVLSHPSRSLTDLAVKWAATNADERKVGVCRLKWEEETKRILDDWLAHNPAIMGNTTVGGRGKKKKDAPQLTWHEKAMKALSYVLRHAAGTNECPINEEGWVRWEDLLEHESCKKFGGWTLWQAIEEDAKDRVVAKEDENGQWWAAAWSGHTQERVVGPAAVVMAGKWRLDLETKIEVDARKACEHGCVFRKTGNEVWLCDRDVPVHAILGISVWDAPTSAAKGASSQHQERETEAASSSSNPAALDLQQYRSGTWQPKLPPRTITEEVVSAARSLGKNLPDQLPQAVEVDSLVGTLEEVATESRFATGGPGEEDECDWSADDSDVEILQATSAYSSDLGGPEVPPQVKEEHMPDAKPEDPERKSEAAGEPSSASSATQLPENTSKGVEEINPKEEKGVEEEAPMRRRKIRFGSAHLHLLRAVAEADTANWESLQTAIQSAPESARVKSELVDRLEQLAELRVTSLVNAEKRAQEHAARTKQYTEAETDYRQGLNDAMLRLEQMNPVGPRSSVPLVSEERLKADIAAGKPIWQARRDHRARERAARKRLSEAQANPRPSSLGTNLVDIPPEEQGEALNASFAASARANLAEFQQVLRAEAAQEKVEKKRKPDSARRKKLKKQRRRDRANTRDDAERDRNHAIAHSAPRPEASFSPGLQGLALASLIPGAKGQMCQEMSQDEFGLLGTCPGVQDVLLVLCFMALMLGATTLVRHFLSKGVNVKNRRWENPEALDPARKVGGTRKKVRFSLPKKGRVIRQQAETPFLGGPRAAARRHPPDKKMRLASVQGSRVLEIPPALPLLK